MAHVVTTVPSRVNQLSQQVIEFRSRIPVLLKFLLFATRLDYSKIFSVTVESECNVCIATELCAGPYGVRILVGTRDSFSPQRPDQLWGPPSLLCGRYWGSIPEGKAAVT